MVSALPQQSSALDVHSWLEAELQRSGDEELLMKAIAALCRPDPERAWDILSLLDQFYRRKRIPEQLFQRVKRRTEQLALGTPAAIPSTAPPTGRPRVLRGRYELLAERCRIRP